MKFDNSGSRYAGPYQGTFAYQDSFLPFAANRAHSTDFYAHWWTQISVFPPFCTDLPDWNIALSGSYATTEPGSSLESNDITSDSYELGLNISWQPIRQRQENLIASLELTGKNTNSDIQKNTPLTRDRIRVVRGRLSYDTDDRWNGYNFITLGVNQGLEILGSSSEDDSNLSRAEAEPDFTTAQFSYTRQQRIYNNFLAIGRLSGQVASSPLFSSEEFGYGGQAFGRAYDPSDITGDHGVAAGFRVALPWLHAMARGHLRTLCLLWYW